MECAGSRGRLSGLSRELGPRSPAHNRTECSDSDRIIVQRRINAHAIQHKAGNSTKINKPAMRFARQLSGQRAIPCSPCRCFIEAIEAYSDSRCAKGKGQGVRGEG